MNAAARLVHQGAITRQLIFVQFLTLRQLSLMLLGLTVVLSSLSIIYVTHLSRELNAGYEQNISDRNHLRVERDQLLLERSTWMVQSRIQQVAENKLGMVFPDRESMVVVSE